MVPWRMPAVRFAATSLHLRLAYNCNCAIWTCVLRCKEDVLADARKQAVSLRLGAADIRRIKALADRLGARDSDVVRFAIKMMLSRMLPLCEPSVRGRRLLPVFAEWGPDAVRHFELDASSLDAIINDGVPADERVEAEDIDLLMMVAAHETYAKLSLRTLTQASKPPVSGDRRDDSPAGALRRHLYRKYGLTGTAADSSSAAEKPDASNVAVIRR
jgi:hypothetical protein